MKALVLQALRELVVTAASRANEQAISEGLVRAGGPVSGVQGLGYLIEAGRMDGLGVDQNVLFYDVQTRDPSGACVQPYRPLDRSDSLSACVRRIAWGRVTHVADNADIDGTRLTLDEASRRAALLQRGEADNKSDKQFIGLWHYYQQNCSALDAYDRSPLSRADLGFDEKLMLKLVRRKSGDRCAYPSRPNEVASTVRLIGASSRMEAVGTRFGVAGPPLLSLTDVHTGLLVGPHIRDSHDPFGHSIMGAGLNVGVTQLVPTGWFTGVPDLFGMIEGDLTWAPGNHYFRSFLSMIAGGERHIAFGPVALRAGGGMGFYGPLVKDGSVADLLCSDDDLPTCFGFLVRARLGSEITLTPKMSVDADLQWTGGTGNPVRPRPGGVQIDLGVGWRL